MEIACLDAAALRAAVSTSTGCGHCSSLVCPGWESVVSPIIAPQLERIGTLRDPNLTEPTVAELHESGTSYWQAEAPIAVAWFPFNRADAWRCPTCKRGFLQYTEFGGYYTEHRIRSIDPALIR